MKKLLRTRVSSKSPGLTYGKAVASCLSQVHCSVAIWQARWPDSQRLVVVVVDLAHQLD